MGILFRTLEEMKIFDQRTILYHGTSNIYAGLIRKRIDCSKSFRTKDFGKAFYMTSNLDHAKRTSKSKMREVGGYPIVL